jgi:hypothetical protein
MNSLKATPGPWEWDGNVWDYDPVFEAPWLEGEDGRLVLRGQITCSSEANAHLIAAAPELYAALEELLRYANDSNDCQYGTLSTRLVKDIAEAALAKARGEIND